MELKQDGAIHTVMALQILLEPGDLPPDIGTWMA